MAKIKALLRMSFHFAQYFLFEFQMFGRGFNDQIGIRDFFQMGGAANMLQSGIAIGFGKFSELNSLGKIAFDRLDAARERIAINVAKQDLVACGRSHLRNAVAHGACAYDADRFNCLRSDARFQSFALVLCKLSLSQ